ncbi:MAG: SMC-Scp complex subunit ScpB [Nitrososphaerota archaeon]|nr:SMC-Scp complex subunit ScpB [Candidatus Bathyarchaeota archaeon]MDW8194317.1 SMC-Scp complex subunit ScpB [Nitrososphaerota archaeon]
MPPESVQKAEPASDRLKRALRLIEAALYVAGRPLDLSEICSVLKTRSREKAKKLVKMLMQEYASRDAALEILEVKGERYVMQLKAELTPYIRRIVKRPLLSTGPLKTLSYIALRQPVSQKRVIEVRGRHAYRHISLLKEMGLITSERRGRATVLRTTDYFADYFGLSHDISVMKRELRKTLGEQFADEKNQQQT